MTEPLNWRSLVGPLYFVDVGARGGFRDMRLLHPLVHMYSLDADTSVDPPFKEFASFHHFPWALHSSEGEMDLHVTEQPGMTSLLEFDEAVFTRHFGLMPGSAGWRHGLTLVRKQTTRTKRADDFFRSQGLPRIDFLKLDTQGTELEILKGAREYLAAGRISVIKTEVGFHPVYRGQCTFSEVDGFLKQFGYVFVDCMFYPDIVHAASRKEEAAVRDVRVRERPRFSSVGDAVYVLDPARSEPPDRAAATTRSAIILNQLGYASLAYHLLTHCGHSGDAAESLLLATAPGRDRRVGIKQWLNDQLPPWLYRKVRRLYRSLFFPS